MHPSIDTDTTTCWDLLQERLERDCALHPDQAPPLRAVLGGVAIARLAWERLGTEPPADGPARRRMASDPTPGAVWDGCDLDGAFPRSRTATALLASREAVATLLRLGRRPRAQVAPRRPGDGAVLVRPRVLVWRRPGVATLGACGDPRRPPLLPPPGSRGARQPRPHPGRRARPRRPRCHRACCSRNALRLAVSCPTRRAPPGAARFASTCLVRCYRAASLARRCSSGSNS